jgi:hypothetical protein
MHSANAYVIRQGTIDDEKVLERLAALDGQRPLSGTALIGEIDGVPAAAVSLVDGRVVADPFKRTAQLVPLLIMRRRALKALSDRPSLPARIRAGLPQARRAAGSHV